MAETGLQAEELFYPKSLSLYSARYDSQGGWIPHTFHPSYSNLTSRLETNINSFLASAFDFHGDDSSVLELAVAAFKSAGSIDSEQNLEKVLDALEIPLLKIRQKLSLGSLMSLCLVALLSYVCAEWTLQHYALSERRLDEQAFALKALFSLIRSSEADEYLRHIQEEAGVRVVSGIWCLPCGESSTC